MDIFSAQKLSDALRPKAEGEPVNAHVLSLPPERRPDFAEMQRIISGISKNDDPRRERSERAVSTIK
jgi:hypothetical protein